MPSCLIALASWQHSLACAKTLMSHASCRSCEITTESNVQVLETFYNYPFIWILLVHFAFIINDLSLGQDPWEPMFIVYVLNEERNGYPISTIELFKNR